MTYLDRIKLELQDITFTEGYVKLWCKNTAGTIVSEPFRIQIKNIF
mgnify:CR=1 FL=1